MDGQVPIPLDLADVLVVEVGFTQRSDQEHGDEAVIRPGDDKDGVVERAGLEPEPKGAVAGLVREEHDFPIKGIGAGAAGCRHGDGGSVR